VTSPPDQVPPASELIFYRSPDGDAYVQLLLWDESFWMPQKAIAELFGVGKAAVSKHLKNIFESGELDPEATVSKMETVRREGSRSITEAELEDLTLTWFQGLGYSYLHGSTLAPDGETSERKAYREAPQ
jgi:hypothetical protein